MFSILSNFSVHNSILHRLGSNRKPVQLPLFIGVRAQDAAVLADPDAGLPGGEGLKVEFLLQKVQALR